MISLSRWKPYGELDYDERCRLTTHQFRERYPEEYAEQERLVRLDPMNQICEKCGKRGLHSCQAPDVPRIAQSWLKGQERYLILDDGSVWEMRKQEPVEPGSPVSELPYRWVLVCEGPKR